MGALEFITIVFIACVAYMRRRQGLLRSAALYLNVILAGLLAFNFWEPLAAALGQAWPRIDPYADALCLSMLFLGAFVLLHLLTGRLLRQTVHFPRPVQMGGGAVGAILSGYLLAGILLAIAQTLPIPRQFLDRPLDRDAGVLRPDLAWLGLVHRASGLVLDNPSERWFDADGSFVHRYARYRRTDGGKAGSALNQGEFEGLLTVTRKPAAEGE